MGNLHPSPSSHELLTPLRRVPVRTTAAHIHSLFGSFTNTLQTGWISRELHFIYFIYILRRPFQYVCYCQYC